jgi:hypothetical protein
VTREAAGVSSKKRSDSSTTRSPGDFRDLDFEPANPWWPATHRVSNQPPPLRDYNGFLSDSALQDFLEPFGAGSARSDLERFGAVTGAAATIDLGFQANAFPPELHTHDRFGVRIDEVRYHPAYHQLMRLATREGLHASHWRSPGPELRGALGWRVDEEGRGFGQVLDLQTRARTRR